MRRLLVSMSLGVLLAGCGATPRAPVVDRTLGTLGTVPQSGQASEIKPVVKPLAAAVDAGAQSHTVRRGDTLYGIALDYGQDYRELAEWNSLSDPNMIREGQVLTLRQPTGVRARPVTGVAAPSAAPLAAANDLIKTEPRALRLPYSEENLALITKPGQTAKPAAALLKPAPVKPGVVSATPPAKVESPASFDADDEKVEWGWPAGGRVTAGFSDPSNKGVDIAGKKGDPVFASAGGKVVYIGEGLRGYGKLVIVKHNNTYLSAYAHNDTIAVREQQAVVKGQKIAEIGSSGADSTKLHFEIRRSGKPVDPMKFLPPRP